MMKKVAPLFPLAAGIFWGSMGIFVRHFSAMGLRSLEIGWIRVIFGLVVVAAYLAVFHRNLLKIRLKDLWIFVGTGVGSLLMVNLTYYSAMNHASLAVACVLLYTAPIFVMLFSALLFREKITPKKLLALALAFVGCALVSGLGSDSHTSALGMVLGLSSGIAYSLYSIFGRYAIQRGYSSWTMTFYTFVFCIAASSLFCDWGDIAMALSTPMDALWGVGLGVVTAFFPYLFYSLGLENMEGSRASILSSVEPVVSALISVFVFHEPMGFGGAIGMVLVLAAVVILSVQPAKKN